MAVSFMASINAHSIRSCNGGRGWNKNMIEKTKHLFMISKKKELQPMNLKRKSMTLSKNWYDEKLMLHPKPIPETVPLNNKNYKSKKKRKRMNISKWLRGPGINDKVAVIMQ